MNTCTHDTPGCKCPLTSRQLAEQIGEIFLEQTWGDAVVIAADRLDKWAKEGAR